MQLTKKQVVELYQALLSVGDLKGARFSYVIAKNTLTIEPEIKAIQKAYTPSKEFTEYDNKRKKLAESHAIKINGQAQKEIQNGVEVYKMIDEPAFLKELKILQAEYELVIKKREEELKQADLILEEKIEINLVKLKANEIPEDIQAKQMTNLFVIIEDEKKISN